MDVTLADQAPSVMAASAKEFLTSMDSTEADYGKFFKYRRPDENGEFPSRIGYYLGLKVAEQIGAGSSLSQLARMQGPSLKQKIHSVLEMLAAQ